ncbi:MULTISPECIES: hypothetical protein [Bacillus amyloliquefaciens group]|uniref:hypothetical protein n=1 Tax=Bacillus amyloliquefaciens group TaxID=1938374 RepID=UPI000A7FE8BE|nr:MULTISPECIES: hypothetical protein [Bacillus amyloliquefaciens group]
MGLHLKLKKDGKHYKFVESYPELMIAVVEDGNGDQFEVAEYEVDSEDKILNVNN